MNKAILIGNLTKDPEPKTTNTGISVANFTIAVSRKFKNAAGEYESDFINCTAWRTTAEFVHKYFKKGQKIAAVGSIQTRTYDADDGSKRYVTEVVVDEVEFVEKKKTDTDTVIEPVEDSGLPF